MDEETKRKIVCELLGHKKTLITIPHETWLEYSGGQPLIFETNYELAFYCLRCKTIMEKKR